MELSSQSGGLVLQTGKIMSRRKSQYKIKYFGLGGGFGIVDMILGGVVLESRRNAVRMSCYKALLTGLDTYISGHPVRPVALARSHCIAFSFWEHD
jgi:hypothetical protein